MAETPREAPATPDSPLLRRAARRLVRGGLKKAARTRAEGRQLLREAGHLLTAPVRLLDGGPPLVERRSHKLGLPPGTVAPMPGREPSGPVSLSALRYDAETLDEHPTLTAAEACTLAGTPGVTWVNLDGVHDTAAVRRLGTAFGLHPLVQEDLTSTTQRPKLESYGDHVFVVVKMVNPSTKPAEEAYEGGRMAHQIEQVAFWLGPNYLLSFEEDPGDVFDGVRQRIQHGAGSLRKHGPDYLLYALLDVVVDHYFVTLEHLGDVTDALEEEVFNRPTPDVLRTINRLRRQALRLRRAIWPMREVIGALLREDTPNVTDRTRVYLRDVYDHVIQAVDAVESVRDVLDGLVNHYLSSMSYRTNEVMRVLTVVGTVFLPLTFITSIYGMNFDYMPELKWRYGYFAVMALIFIVGAAILAVFRWRGYIGGRGHRRL